MTKVRAPPEVMVQTPVVPEVKVTARVDDAVAVKVGVVSKFCAPGLANVMVCGHLLVVNVASLPLVVPALFTPLTRKW